MKSHIRQFSLLLHTECIFRCTSSQSSPQKRQCAFQVSPKNNVYTSAGNVNGSVQHCENTQCCVGYYMVIDGQPRVDVLGKKPQTRTSRLVCMVWADLTDVGLNGTIAELYHAVINIYKFDVISLLPYFIVAFYVINFAVAACDIVKTPCSDATCRAETLFNGRVITCVCNADLCNSNITWTPESQESHLIYPYSGGMTESLITWCSWSLVSAKPKRLWWIIIQIFYLHHFILSDICVKFRF